MKKTKYIYKHQIYHDAYHVGRNEMPDFFQKSGIKLHVDTKNDYYYTWEFAGDTCSWFYFSHSEEVEIEPTVTKLPMENRYKNGYNWKAHKKAMNPRLREAKKKTLEEEKKKNDLLWVDYKNTKQARLNKKKKRKGKDENEQA